MASTMLSGSVKHSPAAAVGGYGYCGRSRPLHGGSICRFGSKRPVAFPPLRASSPSSTAVRSDRPSPAASPPSDFKVSPVPLLLVPPYLLDEDKNKPELEKSGDQYLLYSLPEKELVTVEKNQKSWRRHQIRDRDDAHWVGSSKGWIMYMTRRDSNIYLCNPFSPSNSPIIPLPPIESLPTVQAHHFRRRRSETDETDMTSVELDVEFVLENFYNSKDPDCVYYSGPDEDTDKDLPKETTEKKWFEFPLPLCQPLTVPSEDLVNYGFISKFALSSAPTNNSEELRSCIVAITYGEYESLAICRLGDKYWTHVDGESCYTDIMFSNYTNSKLIARTWSDGIKSCQLSPTKSGSDFSPDWDVIPDLGYEEYEGMFKRDYLVESATDPNLLLMIRTAYELRYRLD